MKAWLLENGNDPDQGGFIVFADTRNEARKQADQNDLMYDSWLDIVARRFKAMDNKEKMDDAHINLELWRDHGWRWFDIDYPDPDTATDEEFILWYRGVFECGKSGGRSIGTGHECICYGKRGHWHKHACKCGALWEDASKKGTF